MSRYLRLATATASIDRSRQAWLAVLGRAKKPEDITEYLWDTITRAGRTAALLHISDPVTEVRLTQPERNALLEENDPIVRDIRGT